MRLFSLGISVVFSILTFGQSANSFISFGLDYRQYPIDIEDVPRGGYSSNALPDNSEFWQVISVHGRYGIKLKKNWSVSLAFYTRYNHLNWLQGYSYVNPAADLAEKKNFKYDAFLDIEKKVQLKKNKERYFFVLAGIGFTNINTHFDVFLQDTLPTGPVEGKRYVGSFCRFSPRLSIGYQYGKIKGSLDAYVIEGPDRTNLTSLWLGATIGYEIYLKKKKRG